MNSQMYSLCAVVFAEIGSAASSQAQELKAGIIGLDTSHVIAFTRVLNDPNA